MPKAKVAEAVHEDTDRARARSHGPGPAKEVDEHVDEDQSGVGDRKAGLAPDVLELQRNRKEHDSTPVSCAGQEFRPLNLLM